MGGGVLLVVGQLSLGGSERQLYGLACFLKDRDLLVDVAVWTPSADAPYLPLLEARGVPVHPLKGSAADKGRALRRLVGRLRPAVVHSFSFFTNAAVWGASLGLGASVLGSSRADVRYELKRLGWARVWLNAQLPRVQVFNSRSSIEVARRLMPLPHHPRRLFVPNGMDLDRFAPTKYPASGQPQLVLGIGSLLPVKRWHLLIEAVNLLQGRGAAVNLRILGGGPEEGRLRQLVAELKAGDYVDLPGPRPDVAAELARASVLAHTSESEGTPNAILEAMACARPVVAFPVGDNAGIVEDGITGLLLQEQSAKAVAHALASLLSNPDLAMEMGKAGRRFVEATHSMEASARAMVQAYRLAGAEELRL